MEIRNEMRLDFTARPENEAFARVVIAAFATQLDPTVEQVEDIKTAVSEAVTNAIIHGYEGMMGTVRLAARIRDDDVIEVDVRDVGRGIPDVAQARQPLYTSRPEMERSGMGFTVMESFMDTVDVQSSPGRGTTIRMTKRIARGGGGHGHTRP